MVTLISQNLSQFELHLRAILSLPIPEITYYGPSASAVVLAEGSWDKFEYEGIDEALKVPGVMVRIFGKPETRPYRRMGVVLTYDPLEKNVVAITEKAKKLAAQIKVT